jgi:hypothetical protein
MDKLPKGCRARYEEIERRADALFDQFSNGNRKDVLEALENMEPRAALAVLAGIMTQSSRTLQFHMVAFFKEMA